MLSRSLFCVYWTDASLHTTVSGEEKNHGMVFNTDWKISNIKISVQVSNTKSCFEDNKSPTSTLFVFSI